MLLRIYSQDNYVELVFIPQGTFSNIWSLFSRLFLALKIILGFSWLPGILTLWNQSSSVFAKTLGAQALTQPRGFCDFLALVYLTAFWSLLGSKSKSSMECVLFLELGWDWKEATTHSLLTTCLAPSLQCFDSQPRICQDHRLQLTPLFQFTIFTDQHNPTPKFSFCYKIIILSWLQTVLVHTSHSWSSPWNHNLVTFEAPLCFTHSPPLTPPP